MPFSKNGIRILDSFLGGLDGDVFSSMLGHDPIMLLAYIQFREQVILAP